MRNMEKIIKRQQWAKATEKNCNCHDAANCPLNVNCLGEGLVYRDKVEPI